MRSTYRVFAGLISLGVLLQAATVAWGWFQVLSDVEGGAVYDENTEFNAGQIMHSVIGLMVIPTLALVLFILSFFARIPGGVKWAGIVFGLAVLQVVLGFVSFGVPILGALHGMNALAMLAVAGIAGRRAGGGAPFGGAPETAPAATTAAA